MVDYEYTLTVEQLRTEVRGLWDQSQTISNAFIKLPEVPPIEFMKMFSNIAMNLHGCDLWEKGKDLQRNNSINKIPTKCEYEVAAGFWVLIRDAIIAERLKNK